MNERNIIYCITPSDYILREIPYTVKRFSEGDFRQRADAAFDAVKKDNPNRYAVITDSADDKELKYLNGLFLSNNIVHIANDSDIDTEKIRKSIEWVFSDFGMNNDNREESTFFISDTHFNHSNIIRYCDRPWNSGRDSEGNVIVTEKDVTDMNEEMIRRWNSVVGKNDTVWHLGDFALGRNQNETIREFVSRLNGEINLVMGNHDHHHLRFYYDCGFHRVYDRPVVINDFFILSHSPLQWTRSDGSVFANLYGHVHNQDMYKRFTSNTYNCCVEVNDYRPVSFVDIKRSMKEFQLRSH